MFQPQTVKQRQAGAASMVEDAHMWPSDLTPIGWRAASSNQLWHSDFWSCTDVIELQRCPDEHPKVCGLFNWLLYKIHFAYIIGVCDNLACITGFPKIGNGQNKWISWHNAVAQQGSPSLDGLRKGFDFSSRAPWTKQHKSCSHPASSVKAEVAELGSLTSRNGEAFSLQGCVTSSRVLFPSFSVQTGRCY